MQSFSFMMLLLLRGLSRLQVSKELGLDVKREIKITFEDIMKPLVLLVKRAGARA